MRQCISFVFRETLGRQLSESAQITACRNFGQLIAEYSVYLGAKRLVVCLHASGEFADTTQNDEHERVLTAEGHEMASACAVSLLEVRKNGHIFGEQILCFRLRN